MAEPPQEIGEYTLMEGSGPAHMYSHAEEISVAEMAVFVTQYAAQVGAA